MRYELTSARQTLKRVTRRLCIEVPSALSEAELAELYHLAAGSPYPKVALGSALAPCGGRAYWDERPHTKEAA